MPYVVSWQHQMFPSTEIIAIIQEIFDFITFISQYVFYQLHHNLDNTICILICIVNSIELGGILVKSMDIAADSG